MRASTLITLGASVAFAGLAVVLARGWIEDAVRDHKGNAPMESTVMMRNEASVPVLVAETEMRFGDELAHENLTLVDYPEGSVPMGALSAYEELFTEPGARIVALTRINPGEPVLDFKVSLPGSRAALAQIISPGMRAATIRVSDAEGVAGFVLPGDRVDVLFVRDEEQDETYGLDMRVDVLMQNVRVLGVDQVLDDQTDGAIVSATATLEVALDDVQKLALAAEVGTLSLTLRPLGEEDEEVTASLPRKHLIQKPAPVRVAQPWRPKRPKVVVPKPTQADETAQVVVIRGEDRDEVNVLSERSTPAAGPIRSDDRLAGGTL